MKEITNNTVRSVSTYNNQPVQKSKTAGKTSGNLGAHKLDKNLAKAGKNKAVSTPHEQNKVLTGIRQKGIDNTRQALLGGSGRKVAKSNLGDQSVKGLLGELKTVKKPKKGVGKPTTGDAISPAFKKHSAFVKSLSGDGMKGVRQMLNKSKTVSAALLKELGKGKIDKFPHGSFSIDGKNKAYKSYLAEDYAKLVKNLEKTMLSGSAKKEFAAYKQEMLDGLKDAYVPKLLILSTRKSGTGAIDYLGLKGWKMRLSAKGTQTPEGQVVQNGNNANSYLVKYEVNEKVVGFMGQEGNSARVDVKGGKVTAKYTVRVDFSQQNGKPVCKVGVQDLNHIKLNCGDCRGVKKA